MGGACDPRAHPYSLAGKQRWCAPLARPDCGAAACDPGDLTAAGVKLVNVREIFVASTRVSMTPHSDGPQMTDRQRGFALLIVLWMLVLVSFIIAHVTTSGQNEL